MGEGTGSGVCPGSIVTSQTYGSDPVWMRKSAVVKQHPQNRSPKKKLNVDAVGKPGSKSAVMKPHGCGATKRNVVKPLKLGSSAAKLAPKHVGKILKLDLSSVCKQQVSEESKQRSGCWIHYGKKPSG